MGDIDEQRLRVENKPHQVNENGPGDVASPRRLVVVHIDPVELQLALAAVLSSRIDSMLIGNNLWASFVVRSGAEGVHSAKSWGWSLTKRDRSWSGTIIPHRALNVPPRTWPQSGYRTGQPTKHNVTCDECEKGG